MDEQSRRYLPAVGFAVLVLVASLIPAPETGGPIPTPFGIAADKWVHAASYAVLTGLLAWGQGSREGAAVAVLATLAVGYGGGIELLQGLVPSRSLSGLDLLANGVGAALGGTLWIALVASVDTLDVQSRT